MLVIVLFILILNVVSILLMYKCLGIESKKEKLIFVVMGTALMYILTSIIYWISTKDIQRGMTTAIPGGGEGGLVNDTFYDGQGGGTYTSTVEGNNSKGSQKVILGNQAQTSNSNNTSNNGGTPLLDGGANNQQQPQQRKDVGAIPPPAADGSVVDVPESDEDEDFDNMDLSF